MDALSKIFEDIHLNHSEYLYLQATGHWAFHSPAQPALMAHIVLFGEAHLQFNNGTHVSLNTGDMFLIPAGLEHVQVLIFALVVAHGLQRDVGDDFVGIHVG